MQMVGWREMTPLALALALSLVQTSVLIIAILL